MNRSKLARTVPLFAIVWAALSASCAFAQLKAPEGLIAPPPAASAPAAAAAGPASSAAPAAAPPQQDPMTAEFRECVKRSKEAMEAKKQEDLPAIFACLTAEVKRQEGRMNSATGRAAKHLTAGEKKALDEANTAWRRFRDANCAFYADPKSPPPAMLENADCQLNLTVGRGQEMEMLAQSAARRAEARAGAKK